MIIKCDLKKMLLEDKCPNNECGYKGAFDKVWDIIKAIPMLNDEVNIVDYAKGMSLGDRDIRIVFNEYRGVFTRIAYGGSEGIYVDVYVKRVVNKEVLIDDIGTIKTLEDDFTAMLSMGKLAGAVSCLVDEYIYTNASRFE